MTGTVAVLLALVAGWLAAGRPQAAMVVFWPFLAVLAIQTWGIAAGHAVSPPSTVTAFPGLIEYYLVQALILALALGIALETNAFRRASEDHTVLAYGINGILVALVVVGFTLDRHFFEPGSVARHSSSGSPPVLGLVGIGLLVLVFAAVSCACSGAGGRAAVRHTLEPPRADEQAREPGAPAGRPGFGGRIGRTADPPDRHAGRS
jgi:hypothetical protein